MGDGLKGFGIVVLLVGAYFVGSAMFMEVTIPTYGEEFIVNLQLMQAQMLQFLLGALLSITGVLTALAGVLVSQLRIESDRILRGELPAPPPEIYA